MKSRQKLSILSGTLAVASAFALLAVGTNTAKAEEAEYDGNGWYIASDYVFESSIAEDGFSAITLDHGGRTFNNEGIDLSKGEFTISLRVGSNASQVATALNILNESKATNWKTVTDKSEVPISLQFLDGSVTPAMGFADEVLSTTWSSNTVTTHTLSVYVGSGAGSDLSYVTYDGVKKYSQVTLEDFKTDGGEYTAWLDLYASYARKMEITDTQFPVIDSLSKDNFDIRGGSNYDLTINYSNAFDHDFVLYTYEYDQTKHVFTAADYTVTPDATDGKKGTITLKKEAFEGVNWMASGAKIYVQNAYGTYAKKLTVVSGDAPAWAGTVATSTEISAEDIGKGYEVEFTYTDADTPILELGQAPADYTTKARQSLATGDGVTLTSNEGKYTLSFSGDYLSGMEKGIYYILIKTKNGDLEFSLYLKPDDGWYARSAKGSVSESELGDNYVKLNLNGWNGDIATDGRAMYVGCFDVTEPIFIEYTNYTAGGWILFDINDNPYSSEYTMENTNSTPSKIKLLDMVPNSDEQRRFGASVGFTTNSSVGFGSYVNSYNSDVLEIYIARKASESYIKVNGHDITSSFAVTVRQAQFSGGKAYLSLFTATQTTFDTNKTVNAPAVTFLTEGEPEYVLKSDKTFTVEVVNVKGALSVSYGGNKLSDGDFTYDSETGKLQIAASYLKRLPFASQFTFTVSADNGSTNFNVKTSVSSANGAATLAEGESNVKYTANSDIAFAFSTSGESFTGLIDADTEETIDPALYTFLDGTLTIKAAAFANKEGIYPYLFTTDASIVPFYVVNIAFNERGYKDLAAAEINATANELQVKGGSEIYFKQTVSLKDGVAYTLKMTSVLGYYNTGNASGNSSSYVDIRLTDVANGLSVVARIRPNGEATNSSIRSKLWAEILLTDDEGTIVKRTPSAYRLSVFDETAIKLSYNNGEVCLYVADEAALTISLEDYDLNLDGMLLSVFTNSDLDGKYMEYVLGGAPLLAAEEVPNETPATSSDSAASSETSSNAPATSSDGAAENTENTADTATDETSEKGCGSVTLNNIALIALLLGAFVCLRSRKKE